MMAEYAEDIRVPSVGKWEMSEGSGLLSDVRRGEKRFPRVCFAPVALRLPCEGGRSWKMSWLCRHPALQTHSCIHRKTNTSLCSPPRNSCEPGNQIWSGSSDLVLFFFLPLNVHAHIFLVRIQSPKNCELCPTALFALLCIHIFSSNKHPTVFLVFAGRKLLSANPIKHQHQPWTDSEIQPLNCHLSARTTKTPLSSPSPYSQCVWASTCTCTHQNLHTWIIYSNGWM